MPYLEKDKYSDLLVEKLCARFDNKSKKFNLIYTKM